MRSIFIYIYKIPRCKSASMCLKCLATYSKVALFCCGIEIAERSCSKESSATCSFECKDVSKAIRARTRIEYQEGCVVEGFGHAFLHSFLQYSIRSLFFSKLLNALRKSMEFFYESLKFMFTPVKCLLNPVWFSLKLTYFTINQSKVFHRSCLLQQRRPRKSW